VNGWVRNPYRTSTGAGWNGDQIVLLAQHLIHLVADMQAEQPVAFHEEADFIFTVSIAGLKRRIPRCFRKELRLSLRIS
jgi:hypothetical protein